MQQSHRRASGRSPASAKAATAQPKDAIAILKADHRQVEQWFEQFEDSDSPEEKADLASQICEALAIHTAIEEEIFYPAFLEATGEEDLHHEAEVEHAGAKHLIAQILDSGPEDDYFDAKVKVLAEMIKHHVKEEEQRGGMFAKARTSDMDLEALGAEMLIRKNALQESNGGQERVN